MPFDPTYPPTNALIESAPLRAQFNGLKDLIDAIATLNAAVVDGVNTLPPGDPAAVFLSLTGSTMHFTFGIPQGDVGPQGQQGPQGLPGEVTQSDLDNAVLNMLGQSSNNSNGVGNLSMNADPAYDQNQMQAVMVKLDELINALRR
jgi:hypothetical protein